MHCVFFILLTTIPSMLEQVLKKSVGEVRIKQGRNESTSFLIIDAQSVKNTEPAEHKGYDARKKISGIKRHILVDSNYFLFDPWR
jgi:hypothetical protein